MVSLCWLPVGMYWRLSVYTLFGDSLSVNCYKVQLLMSHLDIEFDWQHINILGNGTHTTEFLAMNPVGKIPLLKLPDGRYLSESNAILHYLAEETHYIPKDPWHRAELLQWQFFEQYSHEPFLSSCRFIVKQLKRPKKYEQLLASKKVGAHKALQVLEQRLEDQAWLVGDTITIADISLFAFTHVAHEGSIGLSEYPAITEWIKRIRSHEKHVGMSDVSSMSMA